MNALKSLLLVVIGLGSVWWAGSRQDALVVQREVFNPAIVPEEGVPPEVILPTVALGPFRGLMVDMLWMRATRMQDEGRYFELVQLAEWITRLEPRFPEVWAFQAWNMTYNISVLFNDPMDRWRWVQHGIRLLRDEGLINNPRDPDLHWELGWFFQHKLGQDLDSAHFVYKREWARTMDRALGAAQPDYEGFARVPLDRSKLLKIEGMAGLINDIEAAGGDPWSPALLDPASLSEAVIKVLEASDRSSILVYHHRKKFLTEDLKLELEVMQQVDEDYGPFDWRLPQAHSVYWAYRGLPYAKDFDGVQLRRMIFQSMQAAFNEGWLIIDDVTGMPRLSTNIDIVDNTNRAYEWARKDYPDQSTYNTAHRNFLIDAIVKLFIFGKGKKAKTLFDQLHGEFPDTDSSQGFEHFMFLKTVMTDPDSASRDEATAAVESYLYQSLYWLAVGQSERAVGYERLARMNYEGYQSKRRDDPEYFERTGLPPIEQLQENAMIRIRKDFQGSEKAGERLDKAPRGTTLQ